VLIVDVFIVKKIDLNRQFVVPQSFKISLRRQSLPHLLLEVCFGLVIDVQLSLQNLGFLFRFVVEVYFCP
jgi:hypothetical protein